MAPRRLPRQGPASPVRRRTYYNLVCCSIEPDEGYSRSECVTRESSNYRAVETKAHRCLREADQRGVSAGTVIAQYRQIGPKHLLERMVTQTNERGKGDRFLAKALKESAREFTHFVEEGWPLPPAPPVQRFLKKVAKKTKQLLRGKNAPRFELFAVSVTPGAQANLLDKEIDAALARFMRADWGIVTNDIKAANDQAVRLGKGKLRAHYHGARGSFVIIAQVGKIATIKLAEEMTKKDGKP